MLFTLTSKIIKCMKLENQVVSLNLAKRLKELGFKQESLFYYSKNVPQAVDEDYHLYFDGVPDGKSSCGLLSDDEIKEQCYSAYTVAELGEMLPNGIQCKKETDSWYCIWEDVEVCPVAYKKLHGQKYHRDEWAYTEADARAKMIIYLRENNLI